MPTIRPVALILAAIAMPFCVAGCGFIADKDRIVVAKVGGKKITRGDLAKHIREMPDDERPIIQTKADLLTVLNAWINDEIKAQLSKELKKEGKIDVSRDVARERYFDRHPEFRSAYKVQDPSVLEMTNTDLAAVKAEVEFSTDEEVEKLLREEALKYKIVEALQNKTVSLSADEVKAEYENRKDEFIQYEYIEFDALQLPLNMPNAITVAAEVRRRLDAGEKFEAVLQPFVAQNRDFYYAGALQNDPSVDRFRSFWEAAHGATVGQIIGPVLMPEHDEWVKDAKTQQPVKRTRPAAQLVLQISKHEPERQKTLEEAGTEIANQMIKQRVLDQIRAHHGVEVYEAKLPNPAGVGDQYKDSMIKTGKPKRPAP